MGKYEDALERARKGMPMSEVFPELKESEDERIIGNIKKAVELYWSDEPLYEILSWLEKQKKQKPAEVNVKALLTADRLASVEMTGRLKERSEIIDNPEKYGLQQPAEWREEDERRIVELKTFIAQCNGFNKENQKKAFDMIDAIRHQQRWKPSELQMEWLKDVIETVPMTCRQQVPLESLYADLQKLL